jgi:site-specific recombinase XerD
MINATREARFQCFILTVYSMGLRLSEALILRISDIDADHMLVHVHLGKGGKDRFVILPQRTLEALRWYWSSHRHPSLIFPSGANHVPRARAGQPMGGQSVLQAIKAVAKSCNIHKNVTTHSLRHCYATHLIAEGLNLHAIQKILGHKSPLSTAVYTQLTESAHQNSAAIIDTRLNQLSIKLDGQL